MFIQCVSSRFEGNILGGEIATSAFIENTTQFQNNNISWYEKPVFNMLLLHKFFPPSSPANCCSSIKQETFSIKTKYVLEVFREHQCCPSSPANCWSLHLLLSSCSHHHAVDTCYHGTQQCYHQASTKYFLSASTNFWKKIVRESA